MPRFVRIERPQRTDRALPRSGRRAVAMPRASIRTSVPALRRAEPKAGRVIEDPEFQLDPYQDYGRFLTPEGGILIVYKDIDLRWRHTLWRLFAWTLATAADAWLIWQYPQIAPPWLKFAVLIVAAVANGLIVGKPVELYRSIEIRPDCLIIESVDLFWLRNMESWPAPQPDAAGNQRLCGIYGTRFVEYAVIRRFDEFDRMPEVMAAHLRDAMQQLWTQLS